MEKVEGREVRKIPDANRNLCDGPWVQAEKRRKAWRRMKVWREREECSHGDGQREEEVHRSVSEAGEAQGQRLSLEIQPRTSAV